MRKILYLILAALPMQLMLCRCAGNQAVSQDEAPDDTLSTNKLETPHLGLNELQGPVKYVEWLYAPADRKGSEIVPSDDFFQQSSYYGDFAPRKYALAFDRDGICYSPFNTEMFSYIIACESGVHYSDYVAPGEYLDKTVVDSLGRIIYQQRNNNYYKNTWDGNRIVKIEHKFYESWDSTFDTFDDPALKDVKIETTTFEYDKNGNMISKTAPDIEVKYYNHKMDARGNWIERVVDNGRSVEIERRNIIYYPD